MGKYLLLGYIWLLIMAISFENNVIVGVIITLITLMMVAMKVRKIWTGRKRPCDHQHGTTRRKQ